MKITELIKEKTFSHIGKRTTVCLLTLDNGYEITGTSTCLFTQNFDYEYEKEQAEIDALNNFKDLAGYLVVEAEQALKQEGEK